MTIVAITNVFRIFRKNSAFMNPLVHSEHINPIMVFSFEKDLFMNNAHDYTKGYRILCGHRLY
jgi:hypothetical protein